MIERLKKLGLTTYESQAYIALLKLGDSEADEIAQNAKIPMGRIYNVLSSLEEAHLIRAQDTRPRRYACVDPEAALTRLSATKQEELKQASQEIEALVTDLKNELSGVVARKTEKGFWTVAIGNEAHDLIREVISGSRKELLFFMASRMTSERIKKELLKENHAQIMEALYNSIKRGVEVKIILNNHVDFNKLEDSPIVKKLMKHLGKEFNCRLAATPATPFDIIDEENVLLQMLNPLNPEELFAVVNIRDIKLAEELRNKFFMIWDKAELYCEKEKKHNLYIQQ